MSRVKDQLRRERHQNADEIERLREDGKQIRKDWKTDLFNLRKRIKERDERIEELESENVQLKQGYTAVRNDMSRVSRAAKERIEQLERELAFWKEKYTHTDQPMCPAAECHCMYAEKIGHIITDEMIKAAVRLAIINRDQNGNITGFVMLKLFGFELCGKCDGEGEIVPVHKSGFRCPECNGLGAVKEEDE